ncbi:MAG: chromate efflux transporter [Blastocatellia bacterium]|nr:chromate efflux transporter [Blastocatellia bacterium]
MSEDTSFSLFADRSTPSMVPPGRPEVTLRTLAATFSMLGVTGFGGTAVMGLLQDHLVRTKQWLSNREFIESMALGQSLPGPIGPNVVTYVGYRLLGVKGAALALLCYVFPSFVLMVLLAMGYEHTQNVPVVSRLFFGLNPAIAGLVAATAYRIGKSVVGSKRQKIQVCLVFLIVVWFQDVVVLMIFLSIVAGAAWSRYQQHIRYLEDSHQFDRLEKLQKVKSVSTAWKVAMIVAVAVGILWFKDHHLIVNLSNRIFSWMYQHRLVTLAYTSLKLGAFTFGGGYVMVPLLENDVVKTFHWVTHKEFLDGMALGQLTPGPFVITVTFVGYRVAGLAGATVATIGIFLIPFLLVIWAASSIEKFRRNIWVQGGLSGVAPTAIALLAAAATSLGRASLISAEGITQIIVVTTLMVSSGYIVIRYAVNPLYILLGSTLLGCFFA